MNMHYDVAKAEIATRLHQAEFRRAAQFARTPHRLARTPRWQRFRST